MTAEEISAHGRWWRVQKAIQRRVEYFDRQRRAHKELSQAVRSGRLVRRPCETCGAVEVHAHHDCYDDPLSVRWLCPRCHIRHHAAVRQKRKALAISGFAVPVR